MGAHPRQLEWWPRGRHVVLVNILIAKITYTFKATTVEAEGTRRLLRAELLVEMDTTMTTAQRKKDENTYWYCGFDKRRFVTTFCLAT